VARWSDHRGRRRRDNRGGRRLSRDALALIGFGNVPDQSRRNGRVSVRGLARCFQKRHCSRRGASGMLCDSAAAIRARRRSGGRGRGGRWRRASWWSRRWRRGGHWVAGVVGRGRCVGQAAWASTCAPVHGAQTPHTPGLMFRPATVETTEGGGLRRRDALEHTTDSHGQALATFALFGLLVTSCRVP
jgi:hypothetical protein